MKRTKCFKRSAWLSSVSLMHVSFLFHMWNFNFQVQGLRLFLQTSFAIETQTRLMKLNQCYLRNFTSQGRVRRDSNPFSNFCPSHPKPKKIQSTQPSGKNESVVCQTNFRAKNQKCVQSDWASKRAKRFSFQSRDWKDQKVWTKSSWWSEIPRDRLNIPNRSAVRWEKDQTVLSRASQLWIYIYVYIYSIYACSYSYRGDSLTKFLDL